MMAKFNIVKNSYKIKSTNKISHNNELSNCFALFKISRKNIYNISTKTRNEEFTFNYGLNEIAIEYSNKYKLSLIKNLYLRWTYRKLFKSVKEAYHKILDEIEKGDDFSKTKEFLEETLYINLLRDLSLKSKEIFIINKYEKESENENKNENENEKSNMNSNSNKLSKVFIKPVYLYYLYGAEVDRNKNIGKVEALEIRDNIGILKKIIYNSNLSSIEANNSTNNIKNENKKENLKNMNKKSLEIYKGDQKWSEVVQLNSFAIKDSQILNYNKLLSNTKKVEYLEKDLLNELNEEFLESYLKKVLGYKPNNENKEAMRNLIENNQRLHDTELLNKLKHLFILNNKIDQKYDYLKSSNYKNNILLKDYSQEELGIINFLIQRNDYVSKEKAKINVFDYFRLKFPEEFEKENYSSIDTQSNTNKKIYSSYGDPIVIIDLLIQSRRRIVNESQYKNYIEKNNGVISKFKNSIKNVIKENNLRDYEWNIYDKDFIQKHIIRIEFKQSNFTTRLFNSQTAFKITDIDLALDGNKHYKL